MKFILHVFICLLIFSNCQSSQLEVAASLETYPVPNADDAADDPAIYIHPTDETKCAIIGTNKQAGLVVYNLNGEVIHNYDVGRINNVDIRQQFPLNDNENIVLVGGTNRNDNSISLFSLSPQTLELEAINDQVLYSSVSEVYGFCFYQNQETYAIVVGKDGVVEQWLLLPTKEGKISAKLSRTFDVGGQCEGMVADDELDHLYVAEEEVGIWKYSALPSEKVDRISVQTIKDNKQIKADLEGLTIYYAANSKGYLLASSQGNNSYAVFERGGDNAYLGSFKIKNETIDGTSDTDGIDITNLTASTAFPNGFFVVQDGHNKDGKVKKNQNFKVVPWERIAALFSSQLIIDRTYKINH